jgi:galactose oxidase-like protein
MRSHQLRSRGIRVLLPAAICAVAVLAGCGTAQTPARPATPGSSASPAAPESPGTPAASPSASTPAPAPPEAGTWRLLPAAPATARLGSLVSVWTGSQMLIRGVTWGQPPKAVTLSYTPATGTWRTLAPGPAPVTLQGGDNAIWTGREMLTFGPGGTGAYNPVTGTWRPVTQNTLAWVSAVRVWTGRQAIFWGGGCCGEAVADGVGYTPAAGTWQALPRGPLGARWSASGTWTGTEVIIAGGMSEGPAMQVFADAAAYSPATRTWRRLPPMPEPRWGATAVWDGTEVLLIGGTLADAGGPASDGVAFNPATGRWRRLPGMEVNRSAFAAVWTGRQVLVWGGLTGTFQDQKIPPHGVAYDPAANRWSAMPTAPLRGRSNPTAIWTGRQMIVWGGMIPGTRKDTPATDGAAYRPASR